MHEITASTVGQVIRSVHDMQQVSTHSCCSPLAAQVSVQVSAGMQLKAIAHPT